MNVTGTQIVEAVYLIKNGATSITSVQLYNASTGNTVLWANTLGASEWLRFTSETQRAELSTDSGTTWTKRNDNMTGIIPKLKGGENNVLTLTGPKTGTYDITYTPVG